jgi:hypothetical protein
MRRDSMTGGAGEMDGIVVPACVPHAVLESLVEAVYDGSITLTPDNVTHLLCLADAMQVLLPCAHLSHLLHCCLLVDGVTAPLHST